MLFCFDLWTKSLAKKYLVEHERVYILDRYFYLDLTFNRGAFLGLGADWPEWLRVFILVILVLFFLVFLVGRIRKNYNTTLQNICYSMILAGGCGNFFDRVFFGEVTDFFKMNFVIFETGIFNIADMAILFGVIFLFIEDFFMKKKQKSTEALVKNSSQ